MVCCWSLYTQEDVQLPQKGEKWPCRFCSLHWSFCRGYGLHFCGTRPGVGSICTRPTVCDRSLNPALKVNDPSTQAWRISQAPTFVMRKASVCCGTNTIFVMYIGPPCPFSIMPSSCWAKGSSSSSSRAKSSFPPNCGYGWGRSYPTRNADPYTLPWGAVCALKLQICWAALFSEGYWLHPQ